MFLMRVVNGLLPNSSVMFMRSTSLVYKVCFPNPPVWLYSSCAFIQARPCGIDAIGFGL